MRHIRPLGQQLFLACFRKGVALTIAAVLFVSTGFAQTPAKRGTDEPLPADIGKYSEVMAGFGQLIQKIQSEVQFPGSRGPSRLLPLLPKSTVFYLAVPNYGEASHQAFKIFQQELQENASLRQWWHQGDVAKNAPVIEDSMEKIYQLSQYLGDEILVSGADENRKEPSLLVLAEVHKPGLKAFLQELLAKSATKPPPKMRILDAQELATAKDLDAEQQAVILVRPELMAIAGDLTTLRNFNSRLDHNTQEFASTEFGQRIAQTYEGGASVIGALDMQKVLKQIPVSDAASPLFQRSGFADLRYLVWEHKSLNVGSSSQMELSFNGPRRGIASWLAAPGRMRSLDFVSPEATMVSSFLLKDPAQIWDEIRDLATSSNPNSFATVDQMESAMKMSLKEDLLRQLGGEITLEIGRRAQTEQAWKAIFSVKDPDQVQATLDKLLTRAQLSTRQMEEEGVIYHAVQIPSPQQVLDINYAFVDGYLIIASSHTRLSEALRLRRSGGSLAESEGFLAALPPGGSLSLSAMFYEDPVAMAAMMFSRTMPQLSAPLSQATGKTQPLVICGYGEETALRETSRTGGMDAGMIMMVAAIAIPKSVACPNSCQRCQCRGYDTNCEHCGKHVRHCIPAARLRTQSICAGPGSGRVDRICLRPRMPS